MARSRSDAEVSIPYRNVINKKGGEAWRTGNIVSIPYRNVINDKLTLDVLEKDFCFNPL